MKTKIILSSTLVMFFSLTFAQFDLPPGGIPGFPSDNSLCPGGAWCHPDGAGMSLTDEDVDDVNDALEDPDGCYGACTLGKWFSDVIRPLYPDCYPNCNLETNSGQSGKSLLGHELTHINNAKILAAKGTISTQTYNYFKTTLPKKLTNKTRHAVAVEGLEGTKLKLDGMWVYNEKKKNEFHVLSIEPVDHKSGVSYDRLFLLFNKGNMLIVNKSWTEAQKKKKKK